MSEDDASERPVFVVQGPRRLARLVLKGSFFVIGRAEGVPVFRDDPSISREHAVIAEGPAGLLLKDLGSANGVSLNGTRLGRYAEAPIQPGDSLVIGATRLQLVRPNHEPELPKDRTDQIHVGVDGKTRVRPARIQPGPAEAAPEPEPEEAPDDAEETHEDLQVEEPEIELTDDSGIGIEAPGELDALEALDALDALEGPEGESWSQLADLPTELGDVGADDALAELEAPDVELEGDDELTPDAVELELEALESPREEWNRIADMATEPEIPIPRDALDDELAALDRRPRPPLDEGPQRSLAEEFGPELLEEPDEPTPDFE